MNTFFGLPSHPLLVHAATVLLPLAAIGGIVIGFSKSWRDRIGWIVVGLGGAGVVATWLAKESGEALEEAVEGGANSALLNAHTRMGDTLLTWVIPFFVLLLAVMLYDRFKKRVSSGRDPIALLLAVLVVATAGLATYRTIETGHSGAKSVWGDVKVSSEGGESDEGREGGEEGEEGEEGEGGMGAITFPGALIGR